LLADEELEGYTRGLDGLRVDLGRGVLELARSGAAADFARRRDCVGCAESPARRSDAAEGLVQAVPLAGRR